MQIRSDQREQLDVRSNAGREPVLPASRFDDLSGRYRDRGLPNAMTVDVEDYYQVSAFDSVLERKDWEKQPQRLQHTINRVLEMFSAHGVRATFFTLGWVAERYPQLIREIVDAGHELASHGIEHVRVTKLTPAQFAQDVSRSRKLLEDISGKPVVGYRAPSFSINDSSFWSYEILAENGYRYSSSIYPISHDHYGLPSAPRFPFRCSGGVIEVPLATYPAFGRNWPCAGGGYFRLLPLVYTRYAFARLNDVERMPAVFYFHPWEIDPDQPRMSGIPWKSRFRHYVNLKKFEGRLTRMLKAFRWSRMDEIYLNVDK